MELQRSAGRAHATWVKVSAVVAVGGPENAVAVGARP